jgi:hypothetical protein
MLKRHHGIKRGNGKGVRRIAGYDLFSALGVCIWRAKAASDVLFPGSFQSLDKAGFGEDESGVSWRFINGMVQPSAQEYPDGAGLSTGKSKGATEVAPHQSTQSGLI